MQKMPTRDEIESVKKNYPEGCRVVLIDMLDRNAPPSGTEGTVSCVDDIGRSTSPGITAAVLA